MKHFNLFHFRDDLHELDEVLKKVPYDQIFFVKEGIKKVLTYGVNLPHQRFEHILSNNDDT